MSEFIHPPIDTGLERDISMEEAFAERAYEILTLYQVSCSVVGENYDVTYPVTDRVDVDSTEDSIEVALRLMRRQVFAMANGPEQPAIGSGMFVEAQDRSDTYMVLELQYGTLDSEEQDSDEPVVDEDFAWHPYIQAVIEIASGQVSIIDPHTGHDVSHGDLVEASYLLDVLGRELRGIVYDAKRPLDDDFPIVYQSHESSMEEVSDMALLDLNYECEMCGAQNTICSHRSPKWN